MVGAHGEVEMVDGLAVVHHDVGDVGGGGAGRRLGRGDDRPRDQGEAEDGQGDEDDVLAVQPAGEVLLPVVLERAHVALAHPQARWMNTAADRVNLLIRLQPAASNINKNGL